jgi:regulator of protease activity HflC (stomatin/prohibitin superfamily)
LGLWSLLAIGFFIVNPNESMVLTLFGMYKGTVRDNGFFWVNPFMLKKRISLRARNFDLEPIKVNDLIGNPIMIGAVVVWRVKETYKAAFEVNNYEEFVHIQSESALRELAGIYPYDEFEDKDADISLRSGGEVVNDRLEAALAGRLAIAGIEVLEARISHSGLRIGDCRGHAPASAGHSDCCRPSENRGGRSRNGGDGACGTRGQEANSGSGR